MLEAAAAPASSDAVADVGTAAHGTCGSGAGGTKRPRNDGPDGSPGGDTVTTTTEHNGSGKKKKKMKKKDAH